MRGIIYICLAVTISLASVNTSLVNCPPSGQVFLPHPNYCSKFLNCHGGTYTIVNCPDGFYFDPAVGWCGIPAHLGCNLQGNDDENLDTINYVDESATKKNPSTKEDVTEENISEEQVISEENVSDEKTATEEDINDEIDAGLVNCPTSGPTFLPHPNYCSKFLHCRDGTYTILNCAEGFYFDPVAGWCNIPANEGCNLQESEDENLDTTNYVEENTTTDENLSQEQDTTEKNISEEQGTTEENVSDEPGTSEENVSEEQETTEENASEETKATEEDIEDETGTGLVNCPSSGQVFFPHPNYCSKFLQCRDGTYTILNCPEGFYFDPAAGWCGIPSHVGCDLEENGDESSDENVSNETNTTEESISDETEVTETDTTGENGTTEENVSDEKELINCPKLGVHFLPHPSSCSQFINCINGDYVIMDCVGDLHFNPKKGWCDYPANVNCTIKDSDGGVSDGDGSEGSINCPSKGRYFLPHPLTCSQFVKCDNGKYRVINCVEGLHFNPIFGWCESPSKAGCTEVDDVPNEPFACPGYSQKFFPHPSDCSLFIECNFGQYRILSCFPGTYFNPSIGFCDLKSNVQCE